MKIAILTNFPADTDRPHGGVEAVSVSLIRALARLDGLEVHAVTTDRACHSESEAVWEGATIHRLPWAGGGYTLTHAIGRGRRQMSEYVKRLQPDVVHAHDTYGLMVMGLPLPRVFTIHGFIHEDTLINGGRWAWLRSRLWRRAELAGWADQPHIISISPYVRERLRGIASGVIHDIENPVAEECFRIPRQEQKGTVFSAAIISPRKNTLGLIEALARVLDVRGEVQLRLAGSSSNPDYEQRVRECIRARGLGERVTLLGNIGAEQVREELARASVFALVSLEEGAPMGVAEAMAAGVPVVASNRCGMPYMVRDGESGFLVNPEDPADVARRLRQLVEDNALRAAMGAMSRQIAQDRFHPDRVARRTRDVYLRATEDHREGRSCG
ncbi:MAG: glycosyltransferase family 4 protein [Planctomycetota bacterium]|nr:glycosyltransferase family 4 protein [Planctomycetota bacterium]